ncbi:HIT family protein [Candidatus Woesearchaeota archaeon]|nr:HIT family protein [Candidatus Woesearchaeota archaeon]
MSDCEHCRFAEEKELVVFEDELVVAVLAKKPVALGHILVMPKQHVTILEQVPDNVAERAFIIANKVSTALFDVLRINGTNIIVENGTAAGQTTPHFAINVIPRTENDGLKLSWAAKRFSDEQISMAEMQLQKEIQGAPEEQKQSEEKKETTLVGDNELVNHLKRIP